MHIVVYLKFIFLISISLLINGCFATKAPLDTVSNKNSLKGKTLVIGTISRPLEYTGYKTMGLELYDKKKNSEELISIGASEDMNRYTKFENDYVYNDSEGSIFAKLVPSGKYLLTNYTARYSFGWGGFTSKYSREINLASGEIVYIGDMKVLAGNVGGARDCVISNQLNRDFNLFKKHYNFSHFDKDNIKIDVDSRTFQIVLKDTEKEFKELTESARLGLWFAMPLIK